MFEYIKFEDEMPITGTELRVVPTKHIDDYDVNDYARRAQLEFVNLVVDTSQSPMPALVLVDDDGDYLDMRKFSWTKD